MFCLLPGGVGVGHLKPEVPPGATGEIQRVLTAANFYEVLELASDAEPSAVKRAKFAKALLTHPDKAKGAIGANEAFQRVNQVPICTPLCRSHLNLYWRR